jgi:hypothetical protein
MKNSGFFLRTGTPDEKVKLPNKFLCAAAALSLLTFLFVSCSMIGAAEDIILPARRLPIPEYNLEKYVPLPRGGEYPVREQSMAGVRVTIMWTERVDNRYRPLGINETFKGKAVYRADINLKTTNPREYYFHVDNLFYYYEGKVEVEPRDDRDTEERNLSVIYKPAEPEVDADVPVMDYDLRHFVPIPKTGDIVSNSFQRPDVAVKIKWEEMDDKGKYIPVDEFTRFRSEIVYWATITLEAQIGIKNGVGFEYVFMENTHFEYPDDQKVTSLDYLDGTEFDKKTRKLRVEYLPTENRGEGINDLFDLMGGDFRGPKAGKVLDWSFAGQRYAGTIKKWSYGSNKEELPASPPETRKYQPKTVYKAEIALMPSNGYYFDKDLTFEYGGKPFEFKYSYFTGTLSGTIEFPVTDTAITGEIDLSRITPRDGYPKVQNFPNMDERFSVDVRWFYASDGEEFLTAGRAYYMYITLTAKEGYCFFEGLEPTTVKYNAQEKQLEVDESGNPKEMGMGEIQCQQPLISGLRP